MSDPLSVTVLGCSGSYPGPGGACSGYLVEGGGTAVWLDAGSGTLANLQKHLSIVELDAVVISHEHVDHWTDLEHLAVAYKWILGRDAIPVFAQESLQSMLRVGAASEVIDWHPSPTARRCLSAPSTSGFPGPITRCRPSPAGSTAPDAAWPTRPTPVRAGVRGTREGIDLALCEATYLADHEGSLPI